jgi:hypothetical protein
MDRYKFINWCEDTYQCHRPATKSANILTFSINGKMRLLPGGLFVENEKLQQPACHHYGKCAYGI